MAGDVLNLAAERRSVRAYRSDPLDAEKTGYMIECARLAPSACNTQPWRFILVDDPDLMHRICTEALGGAVSNSWAVQAPVIFVLCTVYAPLVHTAGRLFKRIDYRLIDAGIAGEHLCLAAAELGIGTCWIGWFSERKVKTLLGIPRNVKVAALITAGYPAEEKRQASSRLSCEEIAFHNRFGSRHTFSGKDA